jgi:hypothetical protein
MAILKMHSVADLEGSCDLWEPFRLWSLLDMQSYVTLAVCAFTTDLQGHIQEAYRYDANGPLTRQHNEDYPRILKCAEKHFRLLQSSQGQGVVSTLERESTEPHFGIESYRRGLLRIREQLEYELANRQFVYIPAENTEFFKEAYPLSEDVKRKSSPARTELSNAYACLAVDLHTAAVFHLIRATEWGMRAIAEHVGASFPDKPLEWAEWNNLIDQIRSKGNAVVESLGKGPDKDSAMEFYSSVVSSLEHLKQIRNPLMHTRRSFKRAAALAVLEEVRSFLSTVSERIDMKPARLESLAS